jgi:SUMO ligase MMS21 Smc5/6 complex component
MIAYSFWIKSKLVRHLNILRNRTYFIAHSVLENDATFIRKQSYDAQDNRTLLYLELLNNSFFFISEKSSSIINNMISPVSNDTMAYEKSAINDTNISKTNDCI